MPAESVIESPCADSMPRPRMLVPRPRCLARDAERSAAAAGTAFVRSQNSLAGPTRRRTGPRKAGESADGALVHSVRLRAAIRGRIALAPPVAPDSPAPPPEREGLLPRSRAARARRRRDRGGRHRAFGRKPSALEV